MKNLLLSWLICCLILISFSYEVFSQVNLPVVLPPSPEASALFKYEEIPVGQYTGTANFSIPIYTIQSKDFTLPISLNYHSGGIKVSEEASWVGLGWSLSAGGKISRSIRGKDDLGSDGYCDSNNPAPELSLSQFDDPRLLLSVDNFRVRDCEIVDNNSNSQSFCSTGIFINGNGGLESSPNVISDLMPDAFSYSLPNGGGSFFLNKQKTPILEKAGLTQIILGNGATPTWEIRAENGIRYLFEISGDVEIEETGGVPTSAGPSSWPLTRILTPGGADIIFEYQTVNTIVQHPVFSTSKEENTGGFACQNLGPSNETIDTEAKLHYKEYYLKKITFDKGYVEFLSATDRQDLEGSRRLTEVKVYHFEQGNISNPILVNSFVLNNNSYFHGVNSNNTLSMPDPNGYLEKRLKLVSVDSYGSDLSQVPHSHSFTYFEGTGSGASSFDPPNKHSFAQDYWGYYNGKNSNTSLIPEYNGFNPLTGTTQTLTGGDRTVDASINLDYIKAGMLKTITYPTKGTTELEYEMHDFSGAPPVNTQVFAEEESFTAYKNSSSSSGIVPFTIPNNASHIEWEGTVFYDYFSATVGSNGLLVDPDMLKVEIRAVGNTTPILEWDYHDCVYNGFLALGTNYRGTATERTKSAA